MNEPIDFVVTWVDGSDPEWLKKMNQYNGTANDDEQLNGEDRFRPFDSFKYWFRAVEKNAPWVRYVFLITDSQVPEWLNRYSEKLKVVDHKDYIPNRYLPTFNSNVIELNIHRIKELSNNFVLFNDDIFLNQPVEPTDFFVDNVPVEYGVYEVTLPMMDFAHIILNNLIVINQHFNKRVTLKKNFRKIFALRYKKLLLNNIKYLPWSTITGYYNSHVSMAYNKSTFETVWQAEPSRLDEVSTHKFREFSDINQWLMKAWQIETGHFSPQAYGFSKYLLIDQKPEILAEIKTPTAKVFCINDKVDVDTASFEEAYEAAFNRRYPDKSSFEL